MWCFTSALSTSRHATSFSKHCASGVLARFSHVFDPKNDTGTTAFPILRDSSCTKCIFIEDSESQLQASFKKKNDDFRCGIPGVFHECADSQL